jgi:replication fork protection complex subunit Tof1/Swi1
VIPSHTCPDADELEWYIPAGIGLPDLQRALTVIEQFEKAPLDLGGKRASQLLLRKKKRRSRRRQRQRPRHTSADSDGEEEEDDEEDDEEGNARSSKDRTAARAREREVYKSAQFIEDSDEEYGRDIDGFFAREAELRERTALAAVDSALGTGTMRTSGTKKRRRPRGRPTVVEVEDVVDDGGSREAKRRAVSQHPDSDSALSESESAPAPTRRPPKARPRYRGSVTAVAATATTIGDELPTPQRDDPQEGVLTAFLAPDDEDVVSSHGVGDQDRNESDAGEDDENANHGVSSLVGGAVVVVPNGSAPLPRKGRVIISDEEE